MKLRQVIPLAALCLFAAAGFAACPSTCAVASKVDLGTVVQMNGVRESHSRLTITGMSQTSDDTIVHGLPRTPRAISIRKQGSGDVWEKQAPDATNIYLHVEASGPTSVVLDVWY